VDVNVFKVLGEALAIGLLVGAERYRDREEGEKKSAGVRTFALFAVLGSVCGFLVEPTFTLATFAVLAGLVLLGYYRHPAGKLGFTTEVAAILVFWVGYLLHIHEAAAIALGIVLTIFLASKKALHEFAREQISSTEFYATIKFLAVVLVIYPVLPDFDMGPLGFFNPRDFWGLVILVSSISYLGYFLTRWLGTHRGLKVGVIMGGLGSTPATTMSLAERAKSTPKISRLLGVIAVMANSVQGPRLLILIWIANHSLGQSLVMPLLGMGLIGLLTAWLVARETASDPDVEFCFENPFSLTPALKFGAFFLAVLFLTNIANAWFGPAGIFFASAIAGLGSASAAALSVANLVSADVLGLEPAGLAVFLAIAVNFFTKWVLTLISGTGRMGIWLGGGFLVMLAVGAMLLFGIEFPAR
jgi:uncharacterized membrane protein (DUF4010 family)